MPARIVLFDLGNVVVDWEPERLYRRRFQDVDRGDWFCREICTREWHARHDSGIPMEASISAKIAEHPEYAEHIRAWRGEWLDMFHGYVPGVPGLIARLEEQRVPLFGLSNIPAEVSRETFDAFPMIKVLRDVVVSGVERVMKPDRRIYEIALERMGRPDPGDVLFIDDREENVVAARDLGFLTHRFEGAEGLEAELSGQGLL